MCYNPHLRNIANSVHSYEQIIDPYIDPYYILALLVTQEMIKYKSWLENLAFKYQITAMQNTCTRRRISIS